MNPGARTPTSCLRETERQRERDGSWTSISYGLQAGIINARIPQGSEKEPHQPRTHSSSSKQTQEAGVVRISDKKKKLLTNALRFTFAAFGFALASALDTPNPAIIPSSASRPAQVRPQ